MLDHVMSFWNVAVTIFSVFVFLAYLMVTFRIVTDILRDDKLHGFFKALWIVLLLFVPLMTALLYLIFRGKGMANRQRAFIHDAFTATQCYTTKTPVEQIMDARVLYEQKAITEEEYLTLKQKALS